MTQAVLNGRPASPTPSVPQASGNRKGLNRRRMPRADTVLYLASAIAPWWLAILLLGVSMPHLADGFQRICHCGPLAGWLLAVAIDSAQIVSKLQLTVSGRYMLTNSTRWTSAAIIGATSLLSMSLNVLAFLQGAADGTGVVLAWVAGILLPLLILALSVTGSTFALAKTRPQPKAKANRK